MDLFFKKFGSSDIPLFQSQRRGFLSIVKNIVSKVPFSFLLLFHNYLITFYNSPSEDQILPTCQP